jgi:RNA polymerase sigma-70 factor (ECF subfamily)
MIDCRPSGLLLSHGATAAVNRQVDGNADIHELNALRSIRNGSPSGYDYLVAKYMRRTMAICWSVVKNEADAEDLAQEAFVRAYQKIGAMKSDDAFAPWLFRIATNLCLDFLRRKGRFREEELEDTHASPMRSDGIPTEDVAAAIDRALASLPDMQRIVATLYLVEEFSHAEIAAMMKLNEGTVRSHLSLARRKLQVQLRDLFEEVQT